MPSKKKAAEAAPPPEEDVLMDEAPVAEVESPAPENHDSALMAVDEQRIQIVRFIHVEDRNYNILTH